MSPAKLYVGIKAVIIHDDKLLVLRKNTQPGGPFWDLPGGRLESGEAVEQALTRELKEELPSLPSFEIGEILGARKKPEPLMDGTELFLVYYLIITPVFQVILSQEHTEFRWMSSAEISELEEPYRSVYGRFFEKKHV